MKFTVKNAFRDPATGELVSPKPGLVVELEGEHAERLQRANCLVPHQEPQPVPAPPASTATPNGSGLEPAPEPAVQPAPPAQPAPVKGKRGR